MIELVVLVIVSIFLLYVEIACIFAFFAANMLSGFKPSNLLYLLIVAICGNLHFSIYTYMSENYDIQITTRTNVVNFTTK